jgi:acetyl-CoA carboxylase carboxyltransferase component
MSEKTPAEQYFDALGEVAAKYADDFDALRAVRARAHEAVDAAITAGATRDRLAVDLEQMLRVRDERRRLREEQR